MPARRPVAERGDLAIAFRVYPGVSKRPVVHAGDKAALVRLGLASLRRALGGLRVRVHAILDGCPPEYEDLVREYFPGPDTGVEFCDQIGNRATFLRQGEWLLAQDFAEAIFFAEDDYFYRPDTFLPMLSFLKEGRGIDFVTPYDHVDYHVHPLHRRTKLRREHEGRTWRREATTCLTFLTTRTVLGETWPLFRAFADGAADSTIWAALTRILFSPATILRNAPADREVPVIYADALRRFPRQILAGKSYGLWCPEPGFATHLESTGLAPGFSVEELLGLGGSRPEA